MASNLEAGSPAYLVSTKWLLKYYDFILYDQFDNNLSEDQLKYDKETHFTAKHPGMIMNADELCEEDKNCVNLYGTGKIKGMEAHYIDQYVENNRSGQSDNHTIFNEEVWTFLLKRYGG